MSNYFYCQACGGKTQRTSTNVKFCSHCGSSFFANTIKTKPLLPAATIKAAKEPKYVDPIQDDDFDEQAELAKIRARRLKALKSRGIPVEDSSDDGLEGDNDEIVSIPQIDKLELENEPTTERGNTYTLGSLANAPKMQLPPRNAKNPKAKNVNKKKVWATFAAEAGSSPRSK